MDHLLADAHREVTQKTRSEIERETAFKWAARAVAAYQLAIKPWTPPGGLLRDAQDYYHEAIEHAAFADTTGEVLRLVREWIHQYVPRSAM